MDDDIVIRCIRTVVQKSCITAAVLFKFLFRRILDLFGLICHILVLCTIIRIPGLIAAYTDIKFGTAEFASKWRWVGIIQLLIFFMDIPLIIMFVLECIFPWRVVLLHRECKNQLTLKYDNVGFEGFGIRGYIVYHFVMLFLDIISVPFVVMLLCSWRCVNFVNKIKRETSDVGWKIVVVVEWFQLIFDIVTIIFAIPLVFTWRAPLIWRALYKFLKKDSKSVDRVRCYNTTMLRCSVFSNFARLCIDILMLPLILALFFSWRMPILVKKLYQCFKYEGSQTYYDREVKLRKSICHHFIRLLVDISLIPFTTILLFSWRSFIVMKKIKRFVNSQRKKSDENTLRYSLMFHFCQLIFDICTIPACILTICSWRVFNLFQLPRYCHGWGRKSISRKFKKIRIQFWKEALFFILDIPCLVALFIIGVFSFIFPWRFYKVITMWKTADWLQDKHWSDTRYQFLIRSVILEQFVYLWVDIPIGFMAIFVISTGWRLPHLIHRLYTIYHLEEVVLDPKIAKPFSNKVDSKFGRMWYFITKEFCLFFVDLVLGIFALAIVATLWRILPLYRKIKKHSKPEDEKENEREEVVVEATPEIATKSQSETHDNDKEECCKEGQVIDSEGDKQGHESTTLLDDIDNKREENENKEAETTIVQVKHQRTCVDNFFGVRGWKIRKAICLNIFGLVIDIPALLLLLINVLSIYQVPHLIERFVAAGDFYQEFFYIMVEETFNLVKDFCCLMLFTLLIFVRPIDVWIHFLEDKQHMKLRKLKEHLRILRHIMKKEKKHVMVGIESNLSIFIKCHQKISNNLLSNDYVKQKLCKSVLQYTSKLESIRDRLVGRDLDDKAIFYISKIIFYENKRAHYYYRKFVLEIDYIKEPNSALRRNSLHLFEKDMFEYEKSLTLLYESLDNLKVTSVHMWEDKTGFSARTRKETQIVLIHTLTSGYFGTIMLALVNMIFIYRAPLMFYNMWRLKYSKDLVRNVVYQTLKEYLLDLWTLLKIVVVVLSIYRCPDMFSDLTVDIFHKRSVTAIRETVDKYPINILQDLVDLLIAILKWKTIAYIFSSLLFLVLMPFSIIATVCSAACSSSIIGTIVALPIYLVLVSSPFVITHYVANTVLKEDGIADNIIPYILAGYFGAVTLLLALFIIIKSKAKGKNSKKVKPIDYVRFNWFNAQVWMLEALELVQLLALVFSISNLGFTHSETIRTIARYILLDVYGYQIKYGISVVLFVIWFLTCSVPIVLEKILNYVPVDTFTKKHFVWRAYLTFFGSTLFITGPKLNLSFLACDYTNCSNVCPSLFDAPDVICWTGAHAAYASTSFFMIMWYLFTSLLYCMDYTDVENKKVDLHFSPPYSSLVNITKLIFIFSVTLFNEDKLYVLGLAACLLCLLILVSLLFHKMTGLEVSNSKVLLLWRIEVFFVVLTVTLGLFLIEFFEISANISSVFLDFGNIFENVPWSHFIVGVGTLGIVLLSVLCSFVLSKRFYLVSDKIKARRNFKKIAKEIIALVKDDHGLIPFWNNLSTAYSRMLKVVRIAQIEDKEVPDPEPFQLDEIDTLPPPPTYTDIITETSLTFDVPPPLYEDVKDEDTVVIDISKSNAVDPYFLPSVKMYMTACGDWQSYDAKHFATHHGFLDGMQTDLINLTDVQCTGVQLLLLLEENVSYDSLSLEFVKDVQSWRDEVAGSNWIGLELCIKKLRNNIDFSFGTPKEMSTKLESYLPKNEDRSYFPKYFEMTDLTSLKMKMHSRETKKLMELLPQPWVDLFLKLIPADNKNIPLIYRVTSSYDSFDNIIDLNIELFEDVVVTIKDIDEGGFKASVGAQIVLYNPINIRKIRIEKSGLSSRINFETPFPRGKKGMLSHSITSCSGKVDNVKGWLLVAAGKSIRLNKVLASLSHLEWEMKN